MTFREAWGAVRRRSRPWVAAGVTVATLVLVAIALQGTGERSPSVSPLPWASAPKAPIADGVPPGLAPATVPPRPDPCAALRELVTGSSPSRPAPPQLLGALSLDCLHVVPDPWGPAIAAALCETPPERELAVPVGWALAALDAGNASDPPVSDRVLACLLERAAAAEGAELAGLVDWLIRQTEAMPRHFNVVAPSERGLWLAAAIVRRRPPEDLAWWASFWAHLDRAGLPLRRYLLHVMGRDFGYVAARAFVEQCIEWEQFKGPIGPLAVGEAGAALLPFAPSSAPPAAELVPDSARMRLAMLYVVPSSRGLPDEVPWFASEEVQARIERMRREDALGSDPAALTWAVAYAGNQWRLTGDAVALEDLERRFAADEAPIEAFAADDRARLVAALRRAVGAQASPTPGATELAGALRVAIATGLRRATPKAILRLVTDLAPSLEHEGVRDLVVEMLQDRWSDLDPKTKARLTR